MENLTPLSCMSQRGRRTDAALVFSWIFVWIFVPALFGGAFSQHLNKTYILPPCQINESLVIVSVTWGKGSAYPTDETVIAERNRKDKDEPTNEHFSVDKEYQLVIQNATPDDTGIYWCQVTPMDTTGYNCSTTVKPKTSKPTSQPLYRKVTPGGPLIPTSSAEQTFIQCQVLRNLCLLSGVLTIWLTNVGGVG